MKYQLACMICLAACDKRGVNARRMSIPLMNAIYYAADELALDVASAGEDRYERMWVRMIDRACEEIRLHGCIVNVEQRRRLAQLQREVRRFPTGEEGLSYAQADQC